MAPSSTLTAAPAATATPVLGGLAAEDTSTILFAGGGSGGHISPGLAIAERLAALNAPCRASFACSTRDVDAAILDGAGAQYDALPAEPFVRTPSGAVRFVRAFLRARRRARQVITRRRVSQVVTLGGFVAAPVAEAARKMDIPVTLLNLDDPPGRANRWLARRATRVLSAVPTPGLPDFAEDVVGMPIRTSALATDDAATCRRTLGLDPSRHTLLITGASQGSTSINRMIVRIAETTPKAFRGWQVLHLTGAADETWVRDAYAACDIDAHVEAFRTSMACAWGAATLAVSRAGASSVAEAHANAVPTLFLPYPYHRDDHQRRNAQPLVDIAAAIVETDRVDPEANLASSGRTIRALLNDTARLERMRRVLAASPPPDAAMAVACLLAGLPVPS